MAKRTRPSTPLPVWVWFLLILMSLASVAILIAPATVADASLKLQLLAIGGLAVVVTLGTMTLALLVARAYGAVLGRASSESTSDLLAEIESHVMLSDAAKRVLFRDREVRLLRDAIEHHITQRDYSAALTLCEDMASLFGLREEAEEYRERIHKAGQEEYEGQIRGALDQLDLWLADRNWGKAYEDAARIRRLYGGSHLVEDLDGRILQARNEHKRGLEQRFLDAARREDYELAMQLLRDLDRYLDRDEASSLADVAQRVVEEHRQTLSTQFKMAVSDRRWAEAAKIGDAIIREFPNAKMADEVRSMIDVLRTRATQAALAGGGGA